MLSPGDMMIVMIVALIVFGPQKLPEVGRQVGQALRELKKLTSELTDSIQNESEGIKSAFDTVSPYKMNSSPVVSEAKLPEQLEGYSNSDAMNESPLLLVHSEESAAESQPSVSSGQLEAAAVPLTAVKPKSGDEVQ